jgi:multidrug resistance efflux pump
VPWQDDELQGLLRWSELWRLADQAARARARRRVIDLGALWLSLRRASRTRWLKLAAVLALAGLAAMPVPLVLRAPGELVARAPTVLRAGLDGTVRHLLVEPNQTVQAGQVLAELDDASAASRLQLARQGVATAEAEWRQTSQAALGDARAKAQLPAAQGKLQERLTELHYLEQQAQRMALLAPHAGVVLIDDAGSWAGRNVQAGEALMRLAEPQDQELEAWLAVGDAIDLPPGTPMQLHLGARPADPLPAQLRLYAFEAEHRPDGALAYRLRATLAAGVQDRLGARGTVRIEGPTAPLAYALLRRPLAALREWTGW